MTSRRYALRDEQWKRIKDLLPGCEGYLCSTACLQSVVRGSGVVPLPRGHSVGRLALTRGYPLQFFGLF